MARLQIKGLDKIKRELKKLERKAERAGGVRSVPLNELLTPSFMSRYTYFESVEEMFEKSDYPINSQEDFESIPQDNWDAFVNANTLFSSWQEMLNAAMMEQVKQHFES